MYFLFFFFPPHPLQSQLHESTHTVQPSNNYFFWSIHSNAQQHLNAHHNYHYHVSQMFCRHLNISHTFTYVGEEFSKQDFLIVDFKVDSRLVDPRCLYVRASKHRPQGQQCRIYFTCSCVIIFPCVIIIIILITLSVKITAWTSKDYVLNGLCEVKSENNIYAQCQYLRCTISHKILFFIVFKKCALWVSQLPTSFFHVSDYWPSFIAGDDTVVKLMLTKLSWHGFIIYICVCIYSILCF